MKHMAPVHRSEPLAAALPHKSGKRAVILPHRVFWLRWLRAFPWIEGLTRFRGLSAVKLGAAAIWRELSLGATRRPLVPTPGARQQLC